MVVAGGPGGPGGLGGAGGRPRAGKAAWTDVPGAAGRVRAPGRPDDGPAVRLLPILSPRARKLERQRRALLREVGVLQRALLPPVPDSIGAVRASVAYRSSDGPGAGGDFYDAVELSGERAAFILGDVSGHGRQAVARTAFMRFTLRAYLEAGLEPREVLRLAGPVIDHHLDGEFATVVVAIHDPATSSLVYACAGHPPPIVVGPERLAPVLVASSPPIGLDLRTGLRQTALPLRPGAVVCLYTDGLAEARTAARVLGRPRLADIVEGLSPVASAERLLDRVAGEARVTDDMAAMLIRPEGVGGAPPCRRELIEVDAEDASSGLAERFLAACRVGAELRAPALAEARALIAEHGGATLEVRFEPGGSVVDVLPANVVGISPGLDRPGPASSRRSRRRASR